MVIRQVLPMKVSIIGSEDSGQTVFVSLLFAAQIRLSEEKKSGFRFHSSPSCQARIGEAYNRIRGGFWPEGRFKEDISFTLAYELNSIGSRLKKLFGSKEVNSHDMSFRLYRSKERTSLIRSDLETLFTLTKETDHLRGSGAVLFIIDASRIDDLGDVDEVYASIYDHLAGKKIGAPVPFLIFTKYDQIDKDYLKEIELLHMPPMIGKDDARLKYGDKLLKSFLPNLKRSLKGKERYHYFVSVSVEKDEDGNVVPQASHDIQEEIFFSFDEYKHLIKKLGNTSKEQEN